MNLTVYRSWAVILLLSAGLLAWSLYSTQTNQDSERTFHFGLDLVGGSHLVYEADTSGLDVSEVPEAMQALRDVIELRVNVFGVSEPLVQVEQASAFSESEHNERLIVELPGITDLEEAIAMIGATPELEFKLVGPPEGTSTEPTYIETGLTGRYITKAQPVAPSNVQSAGFSMEYIVRVRFNDEGSKLFADLTSAHVGEQLAIFLDGRLLSDPVIRTAITGGTADITGNFTADETKELARNLNLGALPVPIELVSTQTVGATLGAEILEKGVTAGLIGLAAVLVFMLAWYRTPGFVAAAALVIYVTLMFSIFMYVPVTITAAGIAGFLLSIGMAVDANVLIFERFKEELGKGRSYTDAVLEGFKRAWPPIRDGNFTSLISAVVLFWFGTSIVKGFALVFGLGILASMFTAVTITRTFLLALTGIGDKHPAILARGIRMDTE